MEKGKKISNDWDQENKLSSLINDCLNIEKNIKDINELKDIINKCNSNKNLEIKLNAGEEEINNILYSIKELGGIAFIENKIEEKEEVEKIINIEDDIKPKIEEDDIDDRKSDYDIEFRKSDDDDDEIDAKYI